MPNRIKVLNILLKFSFLLLALHLIATALFFYWRYWWFDMPMHLLGGFLSALIVLFVFFLYKQTFDFEVLINHNKILFLALVSAVAIGLSWEIFEYMTGLVDNALDNYKLDVLKDLCADLSGGYLAFRYFKYKVKQFNSNTI